MSRDACPLLAASGSAVSARHIVVGAITGVVTLSLGALTGSPVLVLLAAPVGCVVAGLLRALEAAQNTQAGLTWHMWSALVLVSVVAAVWAEENANQGCSGTLDDTRRLLATLALIAVGTAALWLPATQIKGILEQGSAARRTGHLTLAGLWLLPWSALWLLVWRTMFGCAD